MAKSGRLELTSVSHLGWPSRAAYLGGLGLIRSSPSWSFWCYSTCF